MLYRLLFKEIDENNFITLLLVITSNLKAQTDTNIIYQDIVPDYIVTAPLDTFKVDINNDGLDDVAFYLTQSSPIYRYTKSLQPSSNYAYFAPLESDSLNRNFIWGWRSIGSYWNSSDYDSSRIAVRLINGSDYYYGWIRVFFDKITPFEPRITIKEYAFCKIANYPFLFGQTDLGLGVNELLNENNTQVYFNSSTANIVIQSDKQLKEVKLVNMLGATVKTANDINSLNANISTNNLAHSNYIVQIRYKDNSVYAVQVAF